MPKYQDMYTLQFQSRDSLISKPRQFDQFHQLPCGFTVLNLFAARPRVFLSCHDCSQQQLILATFCHAEW
jgi:hypothetical protein